MIAWELDDEWFIKTSIGEGGREAIPYVFVKCAEHKENKRVARKFEGSVCAKCAEGEEKKGDRRIEERGFGCGSRSSQGMIAQELSFVNSIYKYL